MEIQLRVMESRLAIRTESRCRDVRNRNIENCAVISEIPSVWSTRTPVEAQLLVDRVW